MLEVSRRSGGTAGATASGCVAMVITGLMNPMAVLFDESWMILSGIGTSDLCSPVAGLGPLDLGRSPLGALLRAEFGRFGSSSPALLA